MADNTKELRAVHQAEDEKFRKSEELREQIRRSNIEQLEREQYEKVRSALKPSLSRVYKGIYDD